MIIARWTVFTILMSLFYYSCSVDRSNDSSDHFDNLVRKYYGGNSDKIISLLTRFDSLVSSFGTGAQDSLYWKYFKWLDIDNGDSTKILVCEFIQSLEDEEINLLWSRSISIGPENADGRSKYFMKPILYLSSEAPLNKYLSDYLESGNFKFSDRFFDNWESFETPYESTHGYILDSSSSFDLNKREDRFFIALGLTTVTYNANFHSRCLDDQLAVTLREMKNNHLENIIEIFDIRLEEINSSR